MLFFHDKFFFVYVSWLEFLNSMSLLHVPRDFAFVRVNSENT